jgi:hypothetical protein
MTAAATTKPTAQATFEDLRLNALETAEGFERLAAILEEELGLERAATKLSERAVKLREGRFTLLILGEFKRGKSTLLNAMLGRDLLPRKAAPCTAILTSLRYGSAPAVRVLFTDGRVEHLTPEQFTDKYELKVEDVVGGEDDEATYYQAMAQDRFKDIDMAEVDYPLELCRHGVELVDSPGLAEHAARERRTLEYLKHADAVIMVLDAINFLNQRELAFIHGLNPRREQGQGLRSNLFFLINRWNTLAEGLLDPNDPEEAQRVFGEQSQLIELRLKPLCNVRGVDLSARRIFKINALGALRERAKGAPSASALEKSQVPAFERSLARFLAEDRLKARQIMDRILLQDATTAVADHRRFHEENLDKSLDELKAKYDALQPKLKELRRVGVHIKNALSAMASEVADQMIQSFDEHIKERVRKPLPVAVEKFDLGRVDSLFVTFDAALDLFRPEGKRFKDALTDHLEPQIDGYLRPRVLEWIQAVEKTYLPMAARRVEAELRAEAQQYADILGKVGQAIGGHLEGVSIEDILKRWLKDFGGPNASIVDVGMDLAPLMAGIIADVTAELTLHMSAHVFPGVGVIVSAILLLWRRNRMRANVRKQILEGMNNKLTDFTVKQHEAIREVLRDGFGKLENAIGGKIQDQIAQIDGDMRSLIEQKESHEADASTRRQQLAELQARLGQEARTITALLGG